MRSSLRSFNPTKTFVIYIYIYIKDERDRAGDDISIFRKIRRSNSMEFDNQQNKPTYNVHKKKPRIGLYDDLSTTTQSPQALNTPTYNTSLSSWLPINNTNCLINTSSLPTNNTNLSRKREGYINLSSLFCPQRRE